MLKRVSNGNFVLACLSDCPTDNRVCLGLMHLNFYTVYEMDIQNIEILTAAISEYHGTLIVVSHDETFLRQINAERTIEL